MRRLSNEASLPPVSLALIVDDDDDTRDLYGTFLSGHGYQIEHACDGREALAKAISDPPDVIVTEARLPMLDGYELCRLLRSDRETRGLPIVFVTGAIHTHHVEQAREAGADSVLAKPCLPDVLLRELQRLGRQRGAAGAAPAPVEARIRQSAEDMRPRRAHVFSRDHHRYETTTPPAIAPDLRCPECDRWLRYVRSFLGGVSDKHPEQWDELRCGAGCGHFQYRHRTRRLQRTPV
jgi:two-component system cell cycle response regulator DivK